VLGNGGEMGGGRMGVERGTSWSEQDMKRVMQGRVLGVGFGGYSEGRK
jgi:hypothetical protein